MSEKSRQQVLGVFMEALEIFDQKNADYGDAWRKHGWRGNLPRLFEKMERVKELLWRTDPRTPTVGDETAVETLVDMVNSLAFTVINLREGVEYGHEVPRSEQAVGTPIWQIGPDQLIVPPESGPLTGLYRDSAYGDVYGSSPDDTVQVDREPEHRATPDTPQG